MEKRYKIICTISEKKDPENKWVEEFKERTKDPEEWAKKLIRDFNMVEADNARHGIKPNPRQLHKVEFKEI